MSFVLFSVALVAAASDGPNIWGMLGCATAYAAALLTAVDGLGDALLHREAQQSPKAAPGQVLKTGSKLGASGITVVTAGVVLALDSNWLALIALSLVFVGILLWVFYVYREGGRASA